MPTPLHQYASVPVSADAAEVHRQLRADAEDLVAAATADALTTMGRQAERWGLRISEVPVTIGRATEPTEFGSIEVRWTGREDATGWPALTGRLVVVPEDETASRLLFVSPRSPHVEFATSRLDRLYRQRLTNVGIQRFLHDLAGQLQEPDRRAKIDGASVSSFDRTPMFVHHLEPLAGQPAAVRDLLLADLAGLAERGTEVAVERARDLLAAGRFRAPAAPTIQMRPAQVNQPACGSAGTATRRPPDGPTSTSRWWSRPTTTVRGSRCSPPANLATTSASTGSTSSSATRSLRGPARTSPKPSATNSNLLHRPFTPPIRHGRCCPPRLDRRPHRP